MKSLYEIEDTELCMKEGAFQIGRDECKGATKRQSQAQHVPAVSVTNELSSAVLTESSRACHFATEASTSSKKLFMPLRMETTRAAASARRNRNRHWDKLTL